MQAPPVTFAFRWKLRFCCVTARRSQPEVRGNTLLGVSEGERMRAMARQEMKVRVLQLLWPV